MPRGRPKKSDVENMDDQEMDLEEDHVENLVNSELEDLQALYMELKALGINSISDLEVKIARLS